MNNAPADQPRFDNHTRLPQGSRFVETLDLFRQRKALIAVSVLGLALVIVAVIAGFIAVPLREGLEMLRRNWIPWLLLPAMLIAYIPLHEAIHGAFMLALSGVRPQFGLRLPYCAWAGSRAWFGRISHGVIALAPLALAGAGLQLVIAAAPREWFWPLWIVQISNLSGSAGDLYCVARLARIRGALLIQDDGMRMRVFRMPPKTHP